MACQNKDARSQAMLGQHVYFTCHPAGQSSAACVSSAAPKKNSFDRGRPVWPPQSNVTNDRLRGVFAPPAKNQGVWGGSAPQQNNSKKNYEKNSKMFVKKIHFTSNHKSLFFQDKLEKLLKILGFRVSFLETLFLKKLTVVYDQPLGSMTWQQVILPRQSKLA